MSFVSVEIILLFSIFPVSYTVGVIQIGDLIARFKGIDIREVGTGNPGASNIYAQIGPAYGVAIFFLDLAKGFVPIAVATSLGQPSWYVGMVLVCLIAGHQLRFPLRISGGTGMATAMGAGIAVFPLAALIAVVPASIVLLISKRPSYTGVLAFLVTIVSGWLIYEDLILSIAVLALACTILVKYKSQYSYLLGQIHLI